LLKNFIAHALHPDQVDDCFPDSLDGCAAVEPYLQAIVRNVNAITEKMIWNAHCGAVNMLANDGRDGAPFLDVHQFNKAMFSDFCPDHIIAVASRVNESWHRGISEPDIVRMSTRQYPADANTSPMEEINDISRSMFNEVALTEDLPTGRPTTPVTKAKEKGRGVSGAAVWEARKTSSRGNWLAIPLPEAPRHSPTPPPQAQTEHEKTILDVKVLPQEEVPHPSRDFRGHVSYGVDTPSERCQDSMGGFNDVEASFTRLEELVARYGSDALDSDRTDTSASREDEDIVVEVPSWRAWLINDHKRRLTARREFPSQTSQLVLPSIKQIIAEAVARGIQPTSDDYHDKVRIIEARERQRSDAYPVIKNYPLRGIAHAYQEITLPFLSISSSPHVANRTTPRKQQHVKSPRKRRKTGSSTPSVIKVKTSQKCHTRIDTLESMVGIASSVESGISEPPVSHPSGSTTIDSDQVLPSDAYFETQNLNEKPAWRCGVKHAMGYYYNAGNRSGCPGCFTNVKDCSKTKHMDFYLPPSVYSFQPTDDFTWTPSKALAKSRRSNHLSHNSRAKIAYWEAIDAGATADEARQAGVVAVVAALQPRVPKKLTPEPTPEPEPDLGPHPSGSSTMEHGQDIPECAYFKKRNRQEDSAWRCDVNHALGRYYLAGDKRTCPGCGSNRQGAGKHAEMDFFMPLGVVVRQEATELSRWTPRSPYKLRRSSENKPAKAKYLTHNQDCAKRYHEAIGAGHQHDEAMRIAIEGLEADLDAKQLGAQVEGDAVDEVTSTNSSSTSSRRKSVGTSDRENERDERRLCKTSSGSTVPRKRNFNESSEEGRAEENAYETANELSSPLVKQQIIQLYSSSNDNEGSSGLGSE
jgi:hypothetical protein